MLALVRCLTDARPGRGGEPKKKCAPDIGKAILLFWTDAVVVIDYYRDLYTLPLHTKRGGRGECFL